MYEVPKKAAEPSSSMSFGIEKSKFKNNFDSLTGKNYQSPTAYSSRAFAYERKFDNNSGMPANNASNHVRGYGHLVKPNNPTPKTKKKTPKCTSTIVV
jgi:hypothetical protein